MSKIIMTFDRSGFGLRDGSRLGLKKLIWSQYPERLGRCKSQFENNQFLDFQTQLINMKLTNISALDPRILISKQRRLGFKLDENQLVVGRKLKGVSSEFIDSGVPILVLKEVEIAPFINRRKKMKGLQIVSGNWRRKMKFCLVGEQRMLVFL